MSDFDVFDAILAEFEKAEPIIETEEEEVKACQHIETVEDKGSLFCIDCGISLEKSVFHGKEWRFYGQSDSKRSDPNRVQVRKVDERSIYKDVETMPFSDKAKSIANDLFLEVTKGMIFRGNSRKAIICACMFHAHKYIEIPHTQERLIKIFGLTRKESLKGMKFVNQNAPKGSFVHTTHITPEDLIQDIMNKFGATEEQVKEVVDIYNQIKNRSFKLNGSRPQSVGSGVVYYWISTKGVNITLKEFVKKVNLSELTVLKVVKEITDILIQHKNKIK